MPTPTYTLIEEQVLGSAVASVTLGNGGTIPQTYRDLVVEAICKSDAASSNYSFSMRFNGDTASNYSATWMSGNGTTATSSRLSNQTSILPASGTMSPSSGSFTPEYVHIFQYASTSVNKATLGRGSQSEVYVMSSAGLWRSNAAITSITVAPEFVANFAAGSTFRLWGV